jgi:hypothetical protein
VDLENMREQQPRPAALNASHNGPCLLSIKDHYILYSGAELRGIGATSVVRLTYGVKVGRHVYVGSVFFFMGLSQIEEDMGRHNC